MKITLEKLMEVRKYSRKDLKALARSVIKEILLEEDEERRYSYNFHSIVRDYCDYITQMNLEDILVEAGILNNDKEIDI